MNKRKFLFLNLPHKDQIVRRYMCSYDSPESLLPPIELISLAAIAREDDNDVILLDSIVEKLSENEVIELINFHKPNSIVTITGFECYEQDIDCIRRIKHHFPTTQLVVFGYYASEFPKETLMNSGSDVIILGEPELTFSELIKTESLHEVGGICYMSGIEFIKNGESERIKHFGKLPIPAYDLLPKNKYYEPLIELPYEMIQSMRGCPYKCNYCVKSFGSVITSLSSHEILDHIKIWVDIHQVKTIRFIDDTFTLNRKRVLEICDKLIESKIQIAWMCLSRLDNLDYELLQKMSESGCKRIYLGIESGSTSVLEKLDKKTNIQAGLELLRTSKHFGIEFAAFFLGCLPFESENEFQESVSFARKSKINFASYNPMTPYPGTVLFDTFREQIEFSIYPYKNEWKDKQMYVRFEKRKSIFYRKFYLRFSFFIINFKLLVKYFHLIIPIGYKLIRSFFDEKAFIIGGIKK